MLGEHRWLFTAGDLPLALGKGLGVPVEAIARRIADAGVVDQHVEASVPAIDLCKHCGDRFGVRDVANMTAAVTAAVDHTEGIIERRRVDIGDDHRRTFAGKTFGDRAADAAPGAANQRNLTVEFHGVSPVARVRL